MLKLTVVVLAFLSVCGISNAWDLSKFTSSVVLHGCFAFLAGYGGSSVSQSVCTILVVRCNKQFLVRYIFLVTSYKY